MINFGAVPIGAVLPIFFDSFAGSTGASITLTGLATTDIEVYKGTSMTQRSSDAGYALMDTDGIDLDGVTGIHGFSIDTGDNTDAGFYTSGSFYTVVVSAVTIDTQTVNFVAATFRCVTAEGVAGQPKVDAAAFGGTAGTFSGGRPEVNTTHAAGTAWGSGAITAGSIAADAITAAKIADGAIDATTFAAGAINAAAIATGAIDADALAADAAAEIADAVWDEDATAHQTQGTFGQAVGDPGADTDTIWALVNTNLNATVSSRLASASYTAPLDAAGTRTAVGLASANLDTQIGTLATAANLATVAGYLDTEIAAILADTNELQTDFVNGGRLDLLIDGIKAKTDALPAAPAATGDIPTASAVADAVWDEAIAGHLGVGSTGEALNAAGAAGDPWTTTLPGAYGAGSAGFIIGNNVDAPISTVDTVVDAIKAKTDSLAFTVAGKVDSNIHYVNGVAVTGTGAAGNEWGPA